MIVKKIGDTMRRTIFGEKQMKLHSLIFLETLIVNDGSRSYIGNDEEDC